MQARSRYKTGRRVNLLPVFSTDILTKLSAFATRDSIEVAREN